MQKNLNVRTLYMWKIHLYKNYSQRILRDRRRKGDMSSWKDTKKACSEPMPTEISVVTAAIELFNILLSDFLWRRNVVFFSKIFIRYNIMELIFCTCSVVGSERLNIFSSSCKKLDTTSWHTSASGFRRFKKSMLWKAMDSKPVFNT